MRLKYAIVIEKIRSEYNRRIAKAGIQYTLCDITFERDDASTTNSLNV